ncbi:MAG: RNA polymerase sigma factor RpoH [Gammaproteobacteria bacterium TMED1]|nr:MAG: RNA polymerase sigma factor RpoH [Gammaproteobacteria bacterium TMED1]
MTAKPFSSQLPAVSTGTMPAYIDSLKSIPKLSKEREISLFKRYRDHNDLEAVREIVMAHLHYVVYIARGYSGYGLPIEDLVQQGNLGLMKSVKRFSLDHDVRLVSFAVHWIKAEIHEYILKNWKIVKVATTKAQRKLFFNLRKAKKRLGWLNGEEVNLVAHNLGVKPHDVLEMEQRLSAHDESFEPLDSDQEETIAGPSSYLTSGEEGDPASLVASSELTEMRIRGLEKALASLDDRSRDIVVHRWLTDVRLGLKELAEKYNVSMERIRQIESRAMATMRPHIDGQNAFD